MAAVRVDVQNAILKTFANLPFKPSQALAEFIDNALQSYLDNKSELSMTIKNYKLVIDISFKWGKTVNGNTYADEIVITDNAAGLNNAQFEKAFMTAYKPANDKGLNEFGMGMKTAGCWFCTKWKLETKSISEQVRKSLVFDVNEISNKNLKEIEPTVVDDFNGLPFTKITLTNFNDGNNISKRNISI